ncbi:Crossover junction endonuclease MUS81 [Orchesella cincta]|uniref:Crossover junction endonuclease MUS81 n=1 Tax=Orchesella cincta TaxID=48709 RepID=A0A1D2MRA5_ORCCI|nr:Crossover junction endonuclease MUS81 [Orchesella cincta]
MSQRPRWRGGGSGSQRSRAFPSSKKPCANPIFESWIMEWKEDAETKDSKMKYVYAKALNSLRKYPLPLSTGKECSILENFGSHMCKMIENRMAKENMIPEASQSQPLSEVIDLCDDEPGPSSKVAGGKRKPKAVAVKYKNLAPVVESGDLMELDSEPLPSTSAKPKQRKGKQTSVKRGNPVQFFLTPEGRALAKKLLDAESNASQSQQHHGGSEDVSSDHEASSQDEECAVSNSNVPSGVRLEPGKFEIVLYVDTCETNGKSQDVINELQKNGVTVYVHRLNVGDFVWVCREIADVAGNRNRLTMSRTNELILPYVVERKRTDDLASSIRDGRFHEQKYRLTQTKLQPVYLIESYGKGDWGLAEGALERAVCNTQIENGFLVQETLSIKKRSKTIIGCRKADWTNFKDAGTDAEAHLMFFSDFNDFSVKKMNWKVKEMFARHLMRLKGLSVDKAYAIIQKYPTLDHLLKTYSQCENEKQKESLLSQLEFGTSCRKIGPVSAVKSAVCTIQRICPEAPILKT